MEADRGSRRLLPVSILIGFAAANGLANADELRCRSGRRQHRTAGKDINSESVEQRPCGRSDARASASGFIASGPGPGQALVHARVLSLSPRLSTLVAGLSTGLRTGDTAARNRDCRKSTNERADYAFAGPIDVSGLAGVAHVNKRPARKSAGRAPRHPQEAPLAKVQLAAWPRITLPSNVIRETSFASQTTRPCLRHLARVCGHHLALKRGFEGLVEQHSPIVKALTCGNAILRRVRHC